MPVIRGTVENGLVRPQQELPVPEGAEVRILYDSAESSPGQALEELLKHMRRGLELHGWKWKGREELHDR